MADVRHKRYDQHRKINSTTDPETIRLARHPARRQSSGASSFPYARAATWVDETMSHADQTLLPNAESADKSVAALLFDP